jgi:hypothetical protein
MVIPLSAIIFSFIGSTLMECDLQNYKLFRFIVCLAATGSAISSEP